MADEENQKYQWGVMVDIGAKVPAPTDSEALARALVEVTPTKRNPKLFRRPVGEWEEVDPDA